MFRILARLLKRRGKCVTYDMCHPYKYKTYNEFPCVGINAGVRGTLRWCTPLMRLDSMSREIRSSLEGADDEERTL